MGNDKVYVFLAVRNGEKYIKQAIQSVLNQTYRNFHLVVIVNGSSDNTYSICQRLKANNMVLAQYEFYGKARVLNFGIEYILYRDRNLKWVAIQDADDIWHPTKLEEQMKYAAAYDVIGTDCNYIDASGSIIDINPRPKPYLHEKIVEDAFSGHNPITNCSVLFNYKTVAGISGMFDLYDPNLDGIEDYDLWLRMMRYSNAKFINIPQKLVDHSIHPESHFNTKKFDIQALINKYKK